MSNEDFFEKIKGRKIRWHCSSGSWNNKYAIFRVRAGADQFYADMYNLKGKPIRGRNCWYVSDGLREDRWYFWDDEFEDDRYII